MTINELIKPEYIGDSITVGFDKLDRVVLLKEHSDGKGIAVYLDPETLTNFLGYIITNNLIVITGRLHDYNG